MKAIIAMLLMLIMISCKSPIDIDTDRISEFNTNEKTIEIEITNIIITATFDDSIFEYKHDWLGKTSIWKTSDEYYLTINNGEAYDEGFNEMNPLDKFNFYCDSIKISGELISIINDISDSPGTELTYSFSEIPNESLKIIPDGVNNTCDLTISNDIDLKKINLDFSIFSVYDFRELQHLLNIEINYE